MKEFPQKKKQKNMKNKHANPILPLSLISSSGQKYGSDEIALYSSTSTELVTA